MSLAKSPVVICKNDLEGNKWQNQMCVHLLNGQRIFKIDGIWIDRWAQSLELSQKFYVEEFLHRSTHKLKWFIISVTHNIPTEGLECLWSFPGNPEYKRHTFIFINFFLLPSGKVAPCQAACSLSHSLLASHLSGSQSEQKQFKPSHVLLFLFPWHFITTNVKHTEKHK